jgi:hypothetical protein
VGSKGGDGRSGGFERGRWPIGMVQAIEDLQS